MARATARERQRRRCPPYGEEVVPGQSWADEERGREEAAAQNYIFLPSLLFFFQQDFSEKESLGKKLK